MKLPLPLLLLLAVAPSPEIRYFKYQRPIQTTQQSGQTCLTLDPQIFTHAAPELADLRLYNGQSEIPFVVHLSAPAETPENNLPVMNLGLSKGQTTFNANMPDGNYADLELTLDATDFIATVNVTGIGRENHDQTDLGSYTIFDLTHQKLGRSTALHLPVSNFPELRFQVSSPIKPGNIHGLTVSRYSTSEPRFQTVAQSSHATQQPHKTIFEFTIPANIPIERIAFSPSASPASFSRNISVTVVSEDKDEKHHFQSTIGGNILRLHTTRNNHRIDEERLTIPVSNASQSSPGKWVVTVENADDAPLSLTSVRLEILERQLCLESAANTAYTLYYGDPALASPRYDYASLFTAQARPASASLGPEQPNSRYQPRPDQRPFSEKHPALLWTALLSVVALLAIVAFRTARQSTPPTP
jgi:hypothetical protein